MKIPAVVSGAREGSNPSIHTPPAGKFETALRAQPRLAPPKRSWGHRDAKGRRFKRQGAKAPSGGKGNPGVITDFPWSPPPTTEPRMARKGLTLPAPTLLAILVSHAKEGASTTKPKAAFGSKSGGSNCPKQEPQDGTFTIRHSAGVVKPQHKAPLPAGRLTLPGLSKEARDDKLPRHKAPSEYTARHKFGQGLTAPRDNFGDKTGLV